MKFTVVGTHVSGASVIEHVAAKSRYEAERIFMYITEDKAKVIATFYGFHDDVIESEE